MDKELVLEALSALTNTSVKHVCGLQAMGLDNTLTVQSFIPTVFSKLLFGDLLSVADLLAGLTVNATGNSELRKELFVDLDEFLDPEYDYDFRTLKDFSECSRGGEPYTRPVGWYRFALKVKDKYPDGNKWLGSKGWRSHSEPGEWPVSFHGTSNKGAEGIAKSNYKAGPRMAYGRGVYSTPDIDIAEDYAMSKTFTSQRTGKEYKVIMQNRVNPQKRQIIKKKNFWLIPVPEDSTAEEEREVVESSIRPYGILIKEETQ